MIHLIKKGGKFHVVDVAGNHEVIKASQAKGLTTRKGAFKNIRATAALYSAEKNYQLKVQDDTGEKSRILVVTDTAISNSTEKAGRKYQPTRASAAAKAPGAKKAAKKAALKS